MTVFSAKPAPYALPEMVPGWTVEFDSAPVQTRFDRYEIRADGIVTETATGRRYRAHFYACRAGFPLNAFANSDGTPFGNSGVQLNYLGKRAGAPVSNHHVDPAWTIAALAWSDLCLAMRDAMERGEHEPTSPQEARARTMARCKPAIREALRADAARRASDQAAALMPVADVPAKSLPVTVYLVAVSDDGADAELCEGGVYSDTAPADSDYGADWNVAAAHVECARLNASRKEMGYRTCYEVRDSMAGVRGPDVDVAGSLEPWQLALIASQAPAAWPEGGAVAGVETVASSWDELTEAEKREATFRGFPRAADTRYNVKRRYNEGDWMLTGWFTAGPGQPRTLTERMADYAAVDRSGLSPSDAVDSAIIRGDLDSWDAPATVPPANLIAVGAVDGTFLDVSAPAPVRLRQSRGPDGESRLEYANRIAAPVPSRNRTDNVEWHLGRNDYRAGITECPYADGGDRAARWAAGWQDAKEQAIRDNPESVEALKARIAALEEHIHALSDLLQGWPTIRALSASGARDASERKVKARATVAKMLDIMNREA